MKKKKKKEVKPAKAAESWGLLNDGNLTPMENKQGRADEPALKPKK